MIYYRISKYDPLLRINGIYQRDEWTAFSDVGEQCAGSIVQLSDYLAVESRYISCSQDILDACHVERLCISGLEIVSDGLSWKNGQQLNRDAIGQFLRDSLRELCWARLESNVMRVEVGYEFYLHIGCLLSMEDIRAIADKHDLFVEPWDSFPEA